MQSNIELIIVNNAMSYACDSTACKILRGDDLFELVTSVYPNGQPLNTFWYQDTWDDANDVTPKTADDIKQLNEDGGTIYIVTYPASAVFSPITKLISKVFSYFVPEQPIAGNQIQPPSPNNALSQRANRERIGGRVAEVYGQLRAFFDLIAPTYSVYIDNKEVEYSAMVIGRGWYTVAKMFDDTTPLTQILGASALVFNPGDSFNDTPAYQFGSAFTPEEAAWSRFAAKRYSSVNGQLMPPPDNYLLADNVIFKNPNIIESSGYNFTSQFKVGDSLIIEQADNLASANGLKDDDDNPITYELNGIYVIESLTADKIYLTAPGDANSEWQKLADNIDQTLAKQVTVSTESTNLWQGWNYTNQRDHEKVIANIVARDGLYITNGKDFEPIGIICEYESEIVDNTDNPVAGTLETHEFVIYGGKYPEYAINGGLGEFRNRVINTGFGSVTVPTDVGYWWSGIHTTDEDAARTAARTLEITNSHMAVGKRLRWRMRRVSHRAQLDTSKFNIVQDITVADFYGVRMLNDGDYADDVTKVYLKQRGTISAQANKERKAKGIAQRLVKDWRNADALIASKRIDDIIYDIATDPKTGGLTIDDLNMPQISAEVDAQIAYFGTPLCAEFSGTFDSTDITTEEMIQTVAGAGFFTAYRVNNKVHLHFEKPEEVPVANFNSHNILPESFEWTETFGPRNDYDGQVVTFVDPDNDDTRTTLTYPEDVPVINPDTKNKDLVGVRNKVQAHMHLMRRYHKNQLAYSNVSATVADEGAIVIPNNKVSIANQNRADTQQGAVVSLSVNGIGQTVLTLSNEVDFGDKPEGTVFVQTVAATVDNIKCSPSNDPREVILQRPPSQPISTERSAQVRATYILVTHDDLDRDSYIVTSKGPGNTSMSHSLEAINYTDKYYQNDKDFINGLIA